MRKSMFTLFLVVSLPILSFSQTERDQKIKIRTESQSQTPRPAPQPSNSPRTPEVSQKIDLRNTNQRTTTQNYSFGTTPIYNSRPYYYGNRWNRWGAPYSYSYYNDFYYRNNWGYRTPARVYYQIDGKRDTIYSKKNKTRLGLNMGLNNQIGGWFTVGRDVYFKASVNKTTYLNESTFYSNITMDVVQQWVNSNPAQNYRLHDIEEGWVVYLGVGKEFGNFGANISLGIGEERNYYQYFDGTYILSNNGKYSFNNFYDNYATLSIGITHDFKFLSFSFDYDPIRKDAYLGVGVNF